MRSTLRAAPRDPFETVKSVFATEFPGRSIGDVFDRIEEEPIASASLAQVRCALLTEAWALCRWTEAPIRAGPRGVFEEDGTESGAQGESVCQPSEET